MTKKKKIQKLTLAFKISPFSRLQIPGVFQFYNAQACTVEVRVKRLKKCRDIAAAVLLILFLATPSFASPAPSAYAQTAAKYIGRGEEWGDNDGPWVRKFLDRNERLPWCAGFVSFAMREAGYRGPYRLSARSFLSAGKIVKTPQPGDLVVFSRGTAGHVGIVEAVKGREVIYIDGNHGKFPSVVARHSMKLGAEPNILGYVRVS